MFHSPLNRLSLSVDLGRFACHLKCMLLFSSSDHTENVLGLLFCYCRSILFCIESVYQSWNTVTYFVQVVSLVM